jgi:phosphoribosylformylglycinamidine synthase
MAPDCVSPWVKDLPPVIELPVRHGEGRLVLKPGAEDTLYQQLLENGQIPFYYQHDINGSYKNIAGLCDPSGLVLGMMPHPEAFLYNATYRNIHTDPQSWGQGYFVFKNILRYLGGQEDHKSEQEGQQHYAG